MNQNDYIIRLETPADYRETENVVREAFWNVYRPGCLEHYVLHTYRTNPDLCRSWISSWRRMAASSVR